MSVKQWPAKAVRRARYALHRLRRGRGACPTFDDFLQTEFDRKHGVDTAGRVFLETLEIDGPSRPFGCCYLGSDPEVFRALMADLPADPSRFLFIDLGSGKGRVLLMAAEHGFRRVVGVEFSRELNEVAVRNVAAYSRRRRTDATITPLPMDAASYEFPPEPSVVFYYNSFTGDVLSAVAENMRRSLADSPRELYLVCYSHLYYRLHEAFERTDCFTPVASTPDYAIYRSARP